MFTDNIKTLNKEVITLAILETFDFSHMLVNEIIKVIWNIVDYSNDDTKIKKLKF